MTRGARRHPLFPSYVSLLRDQIRADLAVLTKRYRLSGAVVAMALESSERNLVSTAKCYRAIVRSLDPTPTPAELRLRISTRVEETAPA